MKSSTMQYLKYLTYIILIAFLHSCSSWQYTNYGKPFDFLKAQRFNHKTKMISTKNETKLNLERHKTGLNNTAINSSKKHVNLTKKASAIKNEICEEKRIDTNQSIIKKSEILNHTSSNKTKSKVMNIVAKKIQHQFERALATPNATTSIKEKRPNNKLEEITDFVLLLICLIFPPVAVWWVFDTNKEFWIDLMCYLPFFVFSAFGFDLFILFVLPVLYAIYVIFLQ